MPKSIGIYGIIRIYKNQLSERKFHPATDFLYSCIDIKFFKGTDTQISVCLCSYLRNAVLELNIHFYRAVIGTENFGMDGCLFQLVVEAFRGDEVVNTPSGILLSCFKAVGPPGINALGIRIKVAEGVCESGI